MVFFFFHTWFLLLPGSVPVLGYHSLSFWLFRPTWSLPSGWKSAAFVKRARWKSATGGSVWGWFGVPVMWVDWDGDLPPSSISFEHVSEALSHQDASKKSDFPSGWLEVSGKLPDDRHKSLCSSPSRLKFEKWLILGLNSQSSHQFKKIFKIPLDLSLILWQLDCATLSGSRS